MTVGSVGAKMKKPDLPAERRLGRYAGVAALAGVACWIGALAMANSGLSGTEAVSRDAQLGSLKSISDLTQLTSFHAAQSDQTIAVILRCLGLLLSGVVAVYLYYIVSARAPQVSRIWLLGSAVAGVLLIGVATIEGYAALTHVANEFTASGARTNARATHLVNGSAALTIASILDLVSRIAFAGWIVIISLSMLRVQLLDSFLAYWGYGAAGALVLLPIGDAMFIGWLASLGFLAYGYWPGGRPAGWSKLISTGA